MLVGQAVPRPRTWLLLCLRFSSVHPAQTVREARGASISVPVQGDGRPSPSTASAPDTTTSLENLLLEAEILSLQCNKNRLENSL